MFDIWLADYHHASELGFGLIAVRMLGAALLCGAIGFERELRKNTAGLRTTILIGLAAATFALITLELVADVSRAGAATDDAVRLDPIRLVEAVTGGVAFLAAGLIVYARGSVHGLTTGAGMWLAAGIGLATGLGLWKIALLSTGGGLVVLALLHLVQVKAGLKADAVTLDDRPPD
ncbi:MAG: MgtC/SapB family protein [Lautropia sp.]